MTKIRAASAAIIFVSAAIGVGSACTIHTYQTPPPGSAAPGASSAPVATTTATTTASAPTAYDPCAGKACGVSCTICDPNDKTCVETAVVKQCSAAGKCEATTAQCGTPTTGGTAPTPYNPCAGKKCGDRCRICAPGDTKCVESALVKLCQPDGKCKEATTVDCSKK